MRYFFRLAEYNPKLQEVSAATRVAYAKFKTKMLMSHIDEEDGGNSEQGTPKPKPKTWTSSKKRKIRTLKTTRSSSVAEPQSGGGGGSSGEPRPEKAQAPAPPKKVDKPSDPEKGQTETPILKPLVLAMESADTIERAAGAGKAGKLTGSTSTTKLDVPTTAEDKPSPTATQETGELPSPKEEVKTISSGPGSKTGAGFTVVQIETSGPDDEDGGQSSSGTHQATATTLVPTPTPSTSTGGNTLAPPKPEHGPPSPSHSTGSTGSGRISPSGRSAVTGQTRTGWI
jgi:hypothetical protein